MNSIMEAIFKYGIDSLSKEDIKLIINSISMREDMIVDTTEDKRKRGKSTVYHDTWGEIYSMEYDRLTCDDGYALRGGKHKLSSIGKSELNTLVHKLTKVALGRDIE